MCSFQLFALGFVKRLTIAYGGHVDPQLFERAHAHDGG